MGETKLKKIKSCQLIISKSAHKKNANSLMFAIIIGHHQRNRLNKEEETSHVIVLAHATGDCREKSRDVLIDFSFSR